MLLQNIFWLVQELLLTQREDTQTSSSYKEILGIVFTTKEQRSQCSIGLNVRKSREEDAVKHEDHTQHMQAVPPVWAEGRRHPG